MSFDYTNPTALAARPLGRNTAATVRHWDKLVATIPTAPRLFGGTPPRKSPNVRKFHHRSYLNQGNRGFCVGFNTAGTLMSLLRIPLGATPDSTPLPLKRVNPLYCYDASRVQASKEGINLGWGDGSIGSCAMKAAASDGNFGTVAREDYDYTLDATNNHRNNTVPPSSVQAIGKQHLVTEFAIADSFQSGMELVGSGRPCALASSIPSGMMQTDANGFFRMRGGIVGGHCYQWLDYDQDQNLAWIAQAWIRWGERSTEPEFNLPGADNMFGYTQIGTCPLDELESWFGSNALASGSSEICVPNSIVGWGPLISFEGLTP